MHPVLFEIGPLTLRWYGAMIAAACLAGLWIARQEAERNGIEKQRIEDFFLLALIVAIVGARLYYITFSSPELLWRRPLAAIAIWEGGLAIHGAILGGILVAILFTRRYKISFWTLADTFAPALVLGQAIGRVGCFFNGDAHGYPTDMPWGLVYAPDSPAGQMFPGQPLHPAQLYEMAFNLMIFGVLWRVRKKIKTRGMLFLLYVMLYSAGRIIVEHFRADKLTYLNELSAAQSIGLIGILTAAVLVVILHRRSSAETQSANGQRRKTSAAGAHADGQCHTGI